MLILSLHSKEPNLYNFHYVYTCLSDKLWENLFLCISVDQWSSQIYTNMSIMYWLRFYEHVEIGHLIEFIINNKK